MKKKNNFFCILKVKEWDLELDPDPDPLVRDMNPGIRIRTNMSRIPNTALKVHKIENFFDSDFGICVISLLVISKH